MSAETSGQRAVALRVAKWLVEKGRPDESVQLLSAWAASGPNDQEGQGLLAEALRIDPGARVLRAVDYRPIPGLYAAGEVTGNVIGPQYIGGGNAVTSAVLFGRVAARTATADLRG